MNWIMTVLTLFSAFLMPLTLITGFYWMNIEPLFMATHPWFVYLIMTISILLMILFYLYFKRKQKL
jgi:Mg2+ and Co2+ transporter CorA